MCFPYRPDVAAAALLRQSSTFTQRQFSIESLESLQNLGSLEHLELPNAPAPLPAAPNSSYHPAIPDTHIMTTISTSAIPAATVGLLLPPLSICLPCVPMLGSSSAKPDSAAKCRTILVTDDAPTILKVVTRLLVNHGYMVETANNGSQVSHSNNSPHMLLRATK